MDLFPEFSSYIERMSQIHDLSMPSLEGIEDAEAFSTRLRENFAQISRLAAENRSILEEQLFPLLIADKQLTEEEIREIDSFQGRLLDYEDSESFDLPIAFIVSERLLKDAIEKEDLLAKIRQMDLQISVCYTMMNMTERLSEYPEIASHYRKIGTNIGSVFIQLREKENFTKIESEEARELVLTNARFAAAFYENTPDEQESNLEMLRTSLQIADDPFYTDLMPGFDWQFYRYRILTYFARSTDFCNCRGFGETQLKEIGERTEELWELWHTDPAYFSELENESYVEFHLLKNRYYAGKITQEDYRDSLLQIYYYRDKTLYDICGIVENIQVPVEILGLIRKERYTEPDKALIISLFNDVTGFIFHLPSSGVLTFVLELFMHMMEYFVELPGGPDFKHIMLDMLEALHPPTYVHSRMVAQLAVCLCGHLIDSSPELLIGAEGCRTAEDVAGNRDNILNYTWYAGLCHDAGKICIIDTVLVYGRKLLDMEFDLIKAHSKMGAAMLRRFPSTAKYADIALGHHKWYDNSDGYPEEFDARNSPVKAVIDLIQCADGLDAATDMIGRSYSRGKTLDDYIAEIREGSGTRYAPWLADLLGRPEVREDIEFLLKEGRNQNYQDTYMFLKDVNEES